MKVTGEALLHAPRERVWAALTDPTVLERTIPGCEGLDEVAPDRYRMTITAGVASIKGSYAGEVALTDQRPPSSFVLRASGSGAPGTVDAHVRVSLDEAGDGTTRVSYDADAVVGGPVGGVGQRVLTGVAKKTAAQFFTAVDEAFTALPAGVAPSGAPPPTAPAPPEPPAVEAPPRWPVPAATSGAARGADPKAFMYGALVGAGAALLGALVGGALARRR